MAWPRVLAIPQPAKSGAANQASSQLKIAAIRYWRCEGPPPGAAASIAARSSRIHTSWVRCR